MLLDKRTVGLGSTCVSTSLIQYELDKPLSELSRLVGEQTANAVYLACAAAVDSLWKVSQQLHFKDTEKCPSLYFSASAAHAKRIETEWKARAKIGLPVKLLDERALLTNYGFSASNAIESAQGLTTNAYMLSHALCRHALKHGLQIYDRTTVTGIEEGKRSVKVRTENGFSVRCKYVVNASGYEAGEFMDKKLVRLMSTYAVASENLEGSLDIWKNRAMLWNTANPYLYMRLTTDNRIIVGGRDEPVYNTSGRDLLIKHKSRLLSRDFKKLFPHIDFRPEFSWAGTFGLTPDSMPYIGTIKKHPRIYYALGYGGNGILFSHMAAGIISDAIQGIPNSTARLFSFDRA